VTIFISDFHETLHKDYLQKLSAMREFREYWFSDRHTISGEMRLYLFFSYLLTDLGKLRYNAAKKL